MESDRKETDGQYTLHLLRDPEPFDPRENDNIGTMVCFHRRYHLGDHEQHYNLKDESYCFDSEGNPVGEEVNYGVYFYSCGKFKEVDHAQWFAKEVEARGGIVLPLFLYDHSGITMSTVAFGCRWDSGQVGFIYVTAKRIDEEYGDAPDAKEKAKKYLEGEVEEYDKYLRGNVWQYIIEDEDEENIESCAGFFDEEEAWQDGLFRLHALALDDKKAVAEIDAYEDDRIRTELDQHENFISNH
jgi:hypothetical protein